MKKWGKYSFRSAGGGIILLIQIHSCAVRHNGCLTRYICVRCLAFSLLLANIKQAGSRTMGILLFVLESCMYASIISLFVMDYVIREEIGG